MRNLIPAFLISSLILILTACGGGNLPSTTIPDTTAPSLGDDTTPGGSTAPSFTIEAITRDEVLMTAPDYYRSYIFNAAEYTIYKYVSFASSSEIESIFTFTLSESVATYCPSGSSYAQVLSGNGSYFAISCTGNSSVYNNGLFIVDAQGNLVWKSNWPSNFIYNPNSATGFFTNDKYYFVHEEHMYMVDFLNAGTIQSIHNYSSAHYQSIITTDYNWVNLASTNQFPPYGELADGKIYFHINPRDPAGGGTTTNSETFFYVHNPDGTVYLSLDYIKIRSWYLDQATTTVDAAYIHTFVDKNGLLNMFFVCASSGCDRDVGERIQLNTSQILEFSNLISQY